MMTPHTKIAAVPNDAELVQKSLAGGTPASLPMPLVIWQAKRARGTLTKENAG